MAMQIKVEIEKNGNEAASDQEPCPVKGGGSLPDPDQDRGDRCSPFPLEEIQPPRSTTVKTLI
jgi:hypothetical protein